jgi:hypothetical protein
MQHENIYINFERESIYECGATLISLLAYPDNDKHEIERSELHASLCAMSVRLEHKDSVNDAVPRMMKPIHALRMDKQIARDLKTLNRRMRDRMVAGDMAMHFIKQAGTGKPSPLPKGMKRLSINAVAELVLKGSGQSSPENVKTRIWRHSLPVIHLAAATQVLQDIALKNNLGRLSVIDLLTSRSAIEYVVEEAERYEALLLKLPRKPVDPKKLIRLRLAPK